MRSQDPLTPAGQRCPSAPSRNAWQEAGFRCPRSSLEEAQKRSIQAYFPPIKRYQKIISNKEAILADAQAKADAIIAQAQVKTDELVSEHQIMQQAYAQANEVVMIATKQAQEILDNATNDANNIRMGAMQYTDDILRNLENTISHSMDAAKARHDAYVSSLQGFLDVVTANRAELNPTAEEPETKTTDAQASQADGPKVEISSDMLG